MNRSAPSRAGFHEWLQVSSAALASLLLLQCAAGTPGRTAVAVVEAGAAGAPSGEPASSGKSRAVPDRGDFACGGHRCRAGAESCCEFGSADSHCVPTVAPGPHDSVQPLASQLETCHGQTSLSAIARCGDSRHCNQGEVCCNEWLSSGSSRIDCMPAEGGKPHVCAYGEPCVPGGTCRTPGTECRSGICKKSGVQLRCGGVACGGATPACCGKPAQCRSLGDCAKSDNLPRYDCLKPADCPAGQLCLSRLMGTACEGQLDQANAVLVCESDRDCRDPCPDGKSRPTCRRDGDLATCTCP